MGYSLIDQSKARAKPLANATPGELANELVLFRVRQKIPQYTAGWDLLDEVVYRLHRMQPIKSNMSKVGVKHDLPTLS